MFLNLCADRINTKQPTAGPAAELTLLPSSCSHTEFHCHSQIQFLFQTPLKSSLQDHSCLPVIQTEIQSFRNMKFISEPEMRALCLCSTVSNSSLRLHNIYCTGTWYGPINFPCKMLNRQGATENQKMLILYRYSLLEQKCH